MSRQTYNEVFEKLGLEVRLNPDSNVLEPLYNQEFFSPADVERLKREKISPAEANWVAKTYGAVAFRGDTPDETRWRAPTASSGLADMEFIGRGEGYTNMWRDTV